MSVTINSLVVFLAGTLIACQPAADISPEPTPSPIETTQKQDEFHGGAFAYLERELPECADIIREYVGPDPDKVLQARTRNGKIDWAFDFTKTRLKPGQNQTVRSKALAKWYKCITKT